MIEPINSNGDATTLIRHTTISKHEVLSNQSEEECYEKLEKYKHLVDDNPNLNYPNFEIRNRDIFTMKSAQVS